MVPQLQQKDFTMQINLVAMSGVAADDTNMTTLKGTNILKASFTLVQVETYTTSSGERKQKPHRIQVECWGRLAEMAGTWIGKGKQVCVSGKIEMQSWKDQATEKWVSKIVIRADSIDLLGPKKPVGLDDSNGDGEF
jgi:single-strand DNA-binding protein